MAIFKLTFFRPFCLSVLLMASLFSMGQAVTTPRVPSPAASVSQTIGISTVAVNYSRPSVNARVIWGSLVPYGWNRQQFGSGNEAPWRAGANENTTITFSHDASVEGKPVPAGSYGLFFVVNKDNSGEVILSKDHRSWGSFFYDAKQDELRSPIQLQSIAPLQLLTYSFIDVTKTSDLLVLDWEEKRLPVHIAFDVDKIVMDNAAQELKGPAGFTWQGFFAAANYALQNKTDLQQGLVWINAAAAQNKSFAVLNVQAALLKQLNRTAEADTIMNKAVAVATENELNQYGYQLLNTGEQDKAIEILTINTKRFPGSANVWDSLGEAFFKKGDSKNAIANLKKSLSLDPPAAVKANSEKILQQLGVK